MENKAGVVLITGAAGGVGRAVVEKFAGRGFAIAMTDIDAGRLEETAMLAASFTGGYISLAGDLQDTGFLEKLVDTCMARWGRIDVLVNNAVWRSVETLNTISIEDWEKTLRINLTAPAFLSRITAARLMEQGLACVIINISSVMSELAGGYAPAYTVCKGALESLTYELAVLYGPRGFRVIAVRPGNVDTSLGKDYQSEAQQNISAHMTSEINERTPLNRSADPGEIADAIFWLSSPEASFVTGTCITVDGGLSHNFNAYITKKQLKAKEF
ncbi:SDR family NAD(P)-dependent oxidoreductase [Niabella drilacis]|uniref:NAD(P)-dependent dehydrogenase, short-chain alcohol dehydrogenase family n=1 Tax=Niabella drilacis (strain DSM 25811 / CCM 8410 / CCUG 62505 / LMG 26954 / E90) TaxID=1285928 RepID=A0A1G6S4I4_NIADE|nr:SDR family oxidoreductase [Niabella drilacis]SDD11603.1 NAD(P)-dependent dehydrogenase, short-chain alcohol dehydrogenase family [Niabella drilacis]